MSHDRKFFDTFLLVLGALVLFSVALIVMSNVIGERQSSFIAEDEAVIGQLEERIRPVGQVAVEGLEDPVAREAVAAEPEAPDAVRTIAAASEPAADTGTEVSGEQAYNGACMVCHGMGLAGAPKVGDPAAWEARAAKGADALYANAINGYQGTVGYMPAKGGQADLSDDAVRAAVDYMLAESQ